MSAMVLATNSRVMRNHSFRVADRGQSSSPSRMEPSGQMPSRMFAISPSQQLLNQSQQEANPRKFLTNSNLIRSQKSDQDLHSIEKQPIHRALAKVE